MTENAELAPAPAEGTAATLRTLEASAARASGSCWLLHRWGPWEVKFFNCEVQQFRTCERCGKITFRDVGQAHEWAKWEAYEFSRARELDDEVVDGVKHIVVTHQRRTCNKCGFVEDRFIRYGSLGVSAPTPVPTTPTLPAHPPAQGQLPTGPA